MQSKWCSLLALLGLAWSCSGAVEQQLPRDLSDKPYPCPSEVYCHGELLHAVQMASIYPDSKTFVDMKMRQPSNETLARFGELMRASGAAPTRAQLERFVNESFEPAGSEFGAFDPPDWVAEPRFLRKVRDPALRKFGLDLNHIWKLLGRRMKDEVRLRPELYSIIYVEHPVIVPGGRFREFYYWDSYWIVKGLLHSQMLSTVRGMLDNFVSIVERYGFVPNGGRVYYTQRSQPPMLLSMVQEYLRHSADWAWLERNMPLLEREFEFWMRERSVHIEKDGRNYTLAHYGEGSRGPRPESYREDVLTSQSFRSQEEREAYWAELKTAAETGWDFSSRWFIASDGSNRGNLTNLKTRSIVPVDLNALLYRNARLLAEYSRRLGNATQAERYERRAAEWLAAVEALLWHDEVGAWLDYDMLNDLKRDYFYPTNVLPLWAGCYEPRRRQEHVAKVLKYLERSQIMMNLGGIPSTLEHSGEQWDYPNAWPPLQYFVIMSLDASQDPWAQRLGFEIAQRWVRSNYKAFNETNSMFEKYDATVSGGHGGGGEYEVQLGFGWSNGLILDLLDKYADRLSAEPGRSAADPAADPAQLSAGTQLLTGLLALLMSLAAGFIGLLMYKRRHYYGLADASGAANRRPALGRRQQSGLQQQQQPSRNCAYTELKNVNDQYIHVHVSSEKHQDRRLQPTLQLHNKSTKYKFALKKIPSILLKGARCS